MASVNGADIRGIVDATPDIDAETGTVWDPERVFGSYEDGQVFEYDEWTARDMTRMLERDGQARKIEQVLTLPLMRAPWKIKGKKGDTGQAERVTEWLTTEANADGMSTPFPMVLGQALSAIVYRKAFFEKVFTVRGDAIVYDKIAWRPPQTCELARDERTGAFRGFRQYPPGIGANPVRPIGDDQWLRIPQERAFVYIHGQWRHPLYGTSDMEIPYWALAHGSLVQTPDGPVLIEDVAVGDHVFGVNGDATRVIAVHPQGVRQMYRVTFKDGATVDCDGDHLWGVHDFYRHGGYRVLSTRDMMQAGLRTAHNRWRFATPHNEPVAYPERDLPVDPYVLGAWLGDGSIRKAANGERRYGMYLASQDEWIVDEVRSRLPVDMQLTPSSASHVGDYTFRPVVARDTNPMRDALIALGVNRYSPERFIPELYRRASVKQRWALLRGLMDTDGSADRGSNMARYYTKSPQLAADVQELVRSLGGSAAIRPLRDQWRVQVTLDECPFALPRKAERWRRGPCHLRRKIINIQPIGEAECRCISVESMDGLFLTNDYVVTHNCFQTKQKLRYLWYKFLQRQALPLTVTYGQGDEAKRRANAVAKANSGGVVPMERQGTEAGQRLFDILESSGKGADQFSAALRFLDTEMAGSVLAEFTGLASQAASGHGSLALSSDQSSFYLQSREAIANEFSTAVTNWVVADLVKYNDGPGVPAPEFQLGPISPDDTAQALTLLTALAASPSGGLPHEFIDELAVKVAGFLNLDVDKVQTALKSAAFQRQQAMQQLATTPAQAQSAGKVGQVAGAANAAAAMTRRGEAGQNPMPPKPTGGKAQ